MNPEEYKKLCNQGTIINQYNSNHKGEDNLIYAPDSFIHIETLAINHAIKAGKNDLERAQLVRQSLENLKKEYGKLTSYGEKLLFAVTTREVHDDWGVSVEDAYLSEQNEVYHKPRVDQNSIVVEEEIMENINNDLVKNYDTSQLYVGIYESKDGERIGLFKKDKIHSSGDGTHSYQFYKDILGDYFVAMNLDAEGKDRKAQYNLMTGDPQEKANWKGIIGTANLTDLLAVPFVQDLYPDDRLLVGAVIDRPKTNMQIGEVDRGFGLIELTSAIPNLKANMSLADMLNALINFYSKINLREEAIKQITENLKSVPAYFDNKNEKLPSFFNAGALDYNNIDMSNIPEDFNTIKHR